MPRLPRAWVVFVAVALLTAVSMGCTSKSSSTTVFEGFTGCLAGAASAIGFLQRRLDTVGSAEPEGLAELLPNFDENVRAMLLRAQEVHRTEQGFNDAVIGRVRELVAGGPGGMLLIEVVRERGLGSFDEGGGGLIQLPTG